MSLIDKINDYTNPRTPSTARRSPKAANVTSGRSAAQTSCPAASPGRPISERSTVRGSSACTTTTPLRPEAPDLDVLNPMLTEAQRQEAQPARPTDCPARPEARPVRRPDRARAPRKGSPDERDPRGARHGAGGSPDDADRGRAAAPRRAAPATALAPRVIVETSARSSASTDAEVRCRRVRSSVLSLRSAEARRERPQEHFGNLRLASAQLRERATADHHGGDLADGADGGRPRCTVQQRHFAEVAASFQVHRSAPMRWLDPHRPVEDHVHRVAGIPLAHDHLPRPILPHPGVDAA